MRKKIKLNENEKVVNGVNGDRKDKGGRPGRRDAVG